MNSCGNIVGLARELGVCRRVLYNWRDQLDETNPGRSRELILRKQIIKLKQLLANKTLEVDFFRHALQRVRSEEHTSELQSRLHLVCRLLLEKKKQRLNQAHLDIQLTITDRVPYWM